MLLYIALCLSASLVAGVEEPVQPVWSPVFSLRYESFFDGAHYSSVHVWVDANNSRCRSDYLDGQTQDVYEHKHNEKPVVHRVLPVTTEEQSNVRKCFIVTDNNIVAIYSDPLYILPPMDDFQFAGNERMHDEDASKWRTVSDFPLIDQTAEITMWVADRKGISVPLRLHVVNKRNDLKTRYEGYVNFYDYDPSDIDPEIWNISAGMECEDAIEFDVEKDSALIKKMADLINVSKQNLSGHFNDYLRYFGHYNIQAQMYGHKINQLTHRSKEMGMQRDSSTPSKALPFPYTAGEVERLSKELPKHFDWRLYGAVTPVKDSNDMINKMDYAFAAAEVVEGALFLHKGRKMSVSLSAQAIVDCSWGFGNRGTMSGSVEASFEWIMKHGLPTDYAYPYTGYNDYCHIDSVEIETRIKNYYKVPPNDANALKLAIVNHGPVAIVFDGLAVGSNYFNGVYNDSIACDSTPDPSYMAALAVGYGVLDGEEYWLIKTSHGDLSFMGGYIPIAIAKNTCGVMNSPTYVTIE